MNCKCDFIRYSGTYKWHFGYCVILCYLFRKCQISSGLTLHFFHIIFFILKNMRGIGISSQTTIGSGLYIGHPWGININHNAIIGKNINIHKGVTIGQENRGKRKGAPVIGNEVWIGINATVVGNITIGDDVLIAPNSFVNFDIPSHSVVIGNKIIPKKNATQGYIDNKVIE